MDEAVAHSGHPALTFHEGRELEVTAKELHLEPDDARRLHRAALFAMHGALLAAVTEAT